eukprot:scaffold7884_cov1398-Prasinococcus_capsulatus_cf.AAC.2
MDQRHHQEHVRPGRLNALELAVGAMAIHRPGRQTCSAKQAPRARARTRSAHDDTWAVSLAVLRWQATYLHPSSGGSGC